MVGGSLVVSGGCGSGGWGRVSTGGGFQRSYDDHTPWIGPLAWQEEKI